MLIYDKQVRRLRKKNAGYQFGYHSIHGYFLRLNGVMVIDFDRDQASFAAKAKAIK